MGISRDNYIVFWESFLVSAKELTEALLKEMHLCAIHGTDKEMMAGAISYYEYYSKTVVESEFDSDDKIYLLNMIHEKTLEQLYPYSDKLRSREDCIQIRARKGIQNMG